MSMSEWLSGGFCTAQMHQAGLCLGCLVSSVCGVLDMGQGRVGSLHTPAGLPNCCNADFPVSPPVLCAWLCLLPLPNTLP